MRKQIALVMVAVVLAGLAAVLPAVQSHALVYTLTCASPSTYVACSDELYPSCQAGGEINNGQECSLPMDFHSGECQNWDGQIELAPCEPGPAPYAGCYQVIDPELRVFMTVDACYYGSPSE